MPLPQEDAPVVPPRPDYWIESCGRNVPSHPSPSPSLGHLDVKSTSKELGAALRENGSLVDLSDLSADCNDCLGHCSQRLDCLSTGTGTVLRGLLGHETLTSLSFRDHACREEGAAALAALLGASPILTSLDLSRSEIEDTGAVQLAALKRIASTRGASGTPRRGIRGGRWWAKTGSCSRTVRSSFRRMWCISRRTVASRLQDVVGKLWRRKHRGEEATHPAATDSRCRLIEGLSSGSRCPRSGQLRASQATAGVMASSLVFGSQACRRRLVWLAGRSTSATGARGPRKITLRCATSCSRAISSAAPGLRRWWRPCATRAPRMCFQGVAAVALALSVE